MEGRDHIHAEIHEPGQDPGRGAHQGHDKRVTALTPKGGDPARVAVKSGRTTIAVVGADAAAELGVEVGTALTPDLTDALESAADELKAGRDALRLLSFSARSREELARRLRRKGYDADISDRVCARLERAGLIDDEAFARDAARAELERKPAGARLLEHKLRAKGVPQDVARQAVSDLLAGRDELDDALALARARLARTRDADDRAAARRLLALLARRGFDAETSRRAVEMALDGRAGAADKP